MSPGGPLMLLGSNPLDRKSTRLNSSHSQISYAVFCLKKKTRSHAPSNVMSLWGAGMFAPRFPRRSLTQLSVQVKPRRHKDSMVRRIEHSAAGDAQQL